MIIKGISNRFRNVKKEVQHGRDELVQQILDELRGMVVEKYMLRPFHRHRDDNPFCSAKYFNGLVRLEEDYYKNGKAITRCWEELIDCNDSIAAQFRNALMEHDQNISTMAFPKSLLPLNLKPVSLCRRANA